MTVKAKTQTTHQTDQSDLAFGMLALDFGRVLAVLTGANGLPMRQEVDHNGRYTLTALPGNENDAKGRPLRHGLFHILHNMQNYASVRNNPNDLVVEAAALTIRAKTLPALLVLLQEIANERGLVVDNADDGQHESLSAVFQETVQFMLENQPNLLLLVPATKTYDSTSALYAHIWDLVSAPEADRSIVHYGVGEIRAALSATSKQKDETVPVLRIH
ncbi:hypothetical protein [Micavibrio aeruginosavorus]|uniref:hypothetical protein n=1 Tax=Micavibrio aeruginosavorus TaxID=349221 RepID=UPI003F4AD453